jgi:hypothetical protein
MTRPASTRERLRRLAFAMATAGLAAVMFLGSFL